MYSEKEETFSETRLEQIFGCIPYYSQVANEISVCWSSLKSYSEMIAFSEASMVD